MEDVLSKPNNVPEVVVRDRHAGETVRLSIFRWNPNLKPDGKYESLGHFFGDRITVEKDRVTLDRRLPDRARLAMRHIYTPRESNGSSTYYVAEGFLIPERRFEMIFYNGEPEHVMLSPYPEKIVLAFYNHYSNAQEASKYWTEEGWEREKNEGGGYGCIAPRAAVKDVRVTNLQPFSETYTYEPCQECEERGHDQAIVIGSIICERKDGSEDHPSLRWQLIREDGCWILNSVDEQ